MSKDWQDQQNMDLDDLTGSETADGFSLDEILAEFSSSPHREESVSAPKNKIPVIREPAPAPKPERRPKPQPEKEPEPKRAKKSKGDDSKVIRFPGTKEAPPAAEEAPVPEKDTLFRRVMKRADEYAAQMFKDAEPTPEQKKAERYMPGVDEERPEDERPAYTPRRRRIRQWPDEPPRELATRYSKGLGFLKMRRLAIFFLMLPLLWLHLAEPFSLPLPTALTQYSLQVWICVIANAIAFLLSYDLILSGVRNLGADTLTVAAAVVTLIDGCTLNSLDSQGGRLPYSLVSMAALAFGLWGRYMKLFALRTACRTACAAKNPYLVTLDENRWDGRAVFTKWPGTTEGFGSQIQSDDGAMRVFRPMAGILLLACVLLSSVSSVAMERPQLFLWSLSAALCAAASFSGAMSFALPYRSLTRRLSAKGAALAGWEGIRRQTRDAGILLTDNDLFPPGAVTPNGIKVFQPHPLDKVVAVTATLIRCSDNGLYRIFHDLLQTQGVTYRTAEKVRHYEGGISAEIRGEQVLVGNLAFMHMMDVTMPQQGMNVKNAVFCAIDGQLAGIFALSYALHNTVRPSLYALIDNKISPILATRDFNLIPSMLRQRFKLPSERTQFPDHMRRRQLSDLNQEHDRPLVCVLCREGISPLADAVVGAKRLNLVTRVNAVVSCVGSVIGVLLTFYLTAQMAFASLSPMSLLAYLLFWMVPTILLSGWVNRY